MKIFSMRCLQFIAIVAMLSSIMNTSNSLPSFAAAKTLPDRCAYAFGAAGNKVGKMVSSQITKLDPDDRIPLALESVQLAIELQCPVAELTGVVDCVVDLVTQNGGKEPEIIEIITCIEEVTGHDFPNFQNND